MDDGWNDDDLDLDEGDGWGEDDDGLSMLDEEGDNMEEKVAITKEVDSKTVGLVLNNTTKDTEKKDNTMVADGWDDDNSDDLDFDDDDDDDYNNNDENTRLVGAVPSPAPPPPPPSAPRTTSQTNPTTAAKPSPQEDEAVLLVLRDLQSYVSSLEAVVSSTNTILEAEYNTYDHAMELRNYYTARPKLAEYTIEQELPRMEYRVILPNHQDVLIDKSDIAQYLSTENTNSLLVRCANQSLLADILTVLTGPDLFIRSQFLATAVASHCRFELYPEHVQCQCTMNLSIPGSSGGRFNIAILHASVYFQPDQPALHYKLQGVDVLVNNQTTNELQQSAKFLSTIMQDELFMQQQQLQADETAHNNDAFRDSFMTQLSKTQQFVEASHTGLSSALRQIDAVANVSSKLNFVGGMLPKLQTAPRQVPPPPPPPPRAEPPPKASTAPPQQPTRPAPILGGILMSGLSRLANTITLPDEPPPAPEPAFPKLYRTQETPKKQVPQQDPRPGAPTTKPPRTATIMAPKSALETAAKAQEESQIAETVDDGWDDDDDLDLDDGPETMMKEPDPEPDPAPSTKRNEPKSYEVKPLPAPNTTAAPRSDTNPKSLSTHVPSPPPRKPSVSERVGNDAGADVVASTPRPLKPLQIYPPPPPPVLKNYNPDNDIIETRTRWINPRSRRNS